LPKLVNVDDLGSQLEITQSNQSWLGNLHREGGIVEFLPDFDLDAGNGRYYDETTAQGPKPNFPSSNSCVLPTAKRSTSARRMPYLRPAWTLAAI
jgi:hypothetical protein